MGVGRGCLDIFFSPVYHSSFLSPSLLETEIVSQRAVKPKATNQPIKFHMHPPGKSQKKVYMYVFGPSHMTKMAAMSICGKKLKISSS